MLRDVIGFLRCPHCGAGLALAGGSVRCPAAHSFDVARHGYVSLLPGGARADTADMAAMVAARAAFLGAGHYSAVAEAVAAECELAAPVAAGCLVDVGAGTGYHLARALDRLPDRVGVALDVSKHALRRAARAHPRIGAVACDAWRSLPLGDGAAAVALSVFAPRNGEELARVLAPDGTLVVVTPTDRHLSELVGALELVTVDERKRERLDERLGPFFSAGRERACEWSLSLGHADVAAVVGMGPSARHADPAELGERIAALPSPVAVTASVTVAAYRRR